MQKSKKGKALKVYKLTSFMVIGDKKGVAVVDRFKCAYCGACIAVCKKNANELIETFLYIDEEKCDGCKLCVRVCPMNALSIKVKE